MFLQTKTKEYTESSLYKLKQKLKSAKAVIIGAGAGLSTAAGLEYASKRFSDNFADFAEKYGIKDMYSGGFYPFSSEEEYWAWWSRHIYINRYKDRENSLYKTLFSLVKNLNYFVITTNVDHQFQLAGFDKQRLYYMQGDYGLFQCAKPCHKGLYDNFEQIKLMYENQKDMKVDSSLVPKCPVCGGNMRPNLRADMTFVEGEGLFFAQKRYVDFIDRHKASEILFLELGVGHNTPGIIKYPFMDMSLSFKNATYAAINQAPIACPKQLLNNAVLIVSDIKASINRLAEC